MRRKLSLLYEMHSLSEQANNYISEECVESLGNIVDAKQELIAEVDRLDKLFLDDYGVLKAELGLSSIEELQGVAPPPLRELRLNTAEIMDLLKKIEALDKRFNGGIKSLREDISADLARIRRQKQTSGIYANDGKQRKKSSASDFGLPRNIDAKM
jgi:hypothetical protein